MYAILKESIMGNIHAKLYEFWTSGSGEDVERKSLRTTDARRTPDEYRSQYFDHLEPLTPPGEIFWFCAWGSRPLYSDEFSHTLY